MTTYTAIDGRDHRFDDLWEAVSTLMYHYWRLTRTIIVDLRGRK